MAKVVLTFDDADDSQMISFYSDRNIDLDGDMNAMTSAEQLAALAIKLLDEYIQDAGADVEYQLPKGTNKRLN